LEELLSSKHGLLYVGIILLLHLFFRVAEFAWGVWKGKSDITEISVTELKAEIIKLRTDLRRYYAAIKLIAKDEWPKIREEIMDENL